MEDLKNEETQESQEEVVEEVSNESASEHSEKAEERSSAEEKKTPALTWVIGVVLIVLGLVYVQMARPQVVTVGVVLPENEHVAEELKAGYMSAAPDEESDTLVEFVYETGACEDVEAMREQLLGEGGADVVLDDACQLPEMGSGEVMATVAHIGLFAPERLAVVTLDDEVSQERREGFVEAFEGLIVFDETFPAEVTDGAESYARRVARMRAWNPRTVYLIASSLESVRSVLTEMDTLGMNVVIYADVELVRDGVSEDDTSLFEEVLFAHIAPGVIEGIAGNSLVYELGVLALEEGEEAPEREAVGVGYAVSQLIGGELIPFVPEIQE